jgi:hypothetical protein
MFEGGSYRVDTAGRGSGMTGWHLVVLSFVIWEYLACSKENAVVDSPKYPNEMMFCIDSASMLQHKINRGS